MTLLGTAMRGEKMADYMDEAATHFGMFTAPEAIRLATANSIDYHIPVKNGGWIYVDGVDEKHSTKMNQAMTGYGTSIGVYVTTKEEMMRGKGYCSDCKKEVEVEYCKYWWRDGSPAANDPFHKICCECGGSNVEFLVGPLAINTNISVVMKKLGVIWHGLNKHCQCQYSFAQTLALILPSALGDVAFGDEEFSAAMDEVLASWDNAE